MNAKIYTLDQIRAIERAADAGGYSYDQMMEAAGGALARAIMAWLPVGASHRILVLVGPGNNGGDGLVAARLLAQRGYRVAAYLWKRGPDRLSREADRAGVILRRASDDAVQEQLQQVLLSRCDVVLDAMFGTGLARPLAGEAAAILAALREARATPDEGLAWQYRAPNEAPSRPLLVAVDIPSGLHGDSGEADPATVAADLTVTFIGAKRGMLHPTALPLLGELVVAAIGIPDDVLADADSEAELLLPATVGGWLPPRSANSHKGSYGRVLVVGGCSYYVGAPALAALAAGRSGAGWVTLAVPASIQAVLAAHDTLSSATWLPLLHVGGALRPEALPVLATALRSAQSLVLGPGLGTDEMTQQFVWQLLGVEPAEGLTDGMQLPPTVVDADALNALAAWDGAWWERSRAPLVLTPHPGEMARLTGAPIGTRPDERRAVARRAASRWGQVVVLKGVGTVVAAPDGRTAVAPYANDTLARAGSGDVLSGIIGALLAAGMAPYEAACAGVVAHALTGRTLRESVGGQGALASDLIGRLPVVWRQLRSNHRES